MFKPPICDQCEIKFDKIEALDVHMKVEHAETDHSRIDRRMGMAQYAVSKGNQAIGSTKMYDCGECGIIMRTKEDFETHNEASHSVKRKESPLSVDQSEDDEVEVKVEANIISDLEIETYKDNKGEEHGITIKSKSKDFKDAKEIIKQMIVKGVSYNVGGRHIEVLNVLKNRPGSMTSVVQVKQGGKTGKVELVLWNQSEGKQRHKKSTTIEIKRMPKDGGDFPHVEKVKEILVRLLNRFLWPRL